MGPFPYIDSAVTSDNTIIAEYSINPWTGVTINNPVKVAGSGNTVPGTLTDPDPIYLFARQTEPNANWCVLDSFNILTIVGNKRPTIELMSDDGTTVVSSFTFGSLVGPRTGWNTVSAPADNTFYLTDAAGLNANEIRDSVAKGSTALSNMPGAIFVSATYKDKLFRIRNAYSYISVVAVGAFLRYFDGLIRNATYDPSRYRLAQYDGNSRLRSDQSSIDDKRSVVTRGELVHEITGTYFFKNLTLRFGPENNVTAADAATTSNAVALPKFDYNGTALKEHVFNDSTFFQVMFPGTENEKEGMKQRIVIDHIGLETSTSAGSIVFGRTPYLGQHSGLNVFTINVLIVADRRAPYASYTYN